MADISTVNMQKRSEQANALSATQNDENLGALETAVNALIARSNIVSKYGAMYLEDNTTTTGTLTADTWTNVTVADIAVHDEYNGIAFNSTYKGLAVDTSSTYEVECHLSFKGTATNTVWFTMGVGDGTTQTPQTAHQVSRKLGTADIGAASFAGTVTATNGQIINLMIKQDATQAVTIENMTFVARGIPTT